MPDDITPAGPSPILLESIERRIYVFRGQRVMLDSDLAELYQVPTRALNQAVKRNPDRFPADFMFQLTKTELENWRSQIVTSNPVVKMALRRPPYAFTELGVAMLSSVLHSDRAVKMNILIMRAFVRLREVLATHKELARKVEKLETGQRDHTIAIGLVAQDIQALAKSVKKEFKKLKSPRRQKSRIGFHIPDYK